ncbi:FHA domain-containing protein [Antrihabitans sp. YC3-6]|uniref:FHA domain-containing protein n=1 Tax=Antrihabitans stalagmiti TaxID=2799499 RepID=A0A934U3B5_9NOCA|nr:BTAD domain-containing putative transcriptional regulator [Antrihabitans stalagmiti]MBJ8339555.1 FHA domain-containing protein [Antrihabitans stalagmiti]
MTGPRVDLRVLGPVQLTVDGQPLAIGGPKPRTMLALLAVNRRRTVPSEAIADAVWDDDPPDAYASSLQVFVSNLRKTLRTAGVDPAALLTTASPGYRLEIADVESDLGRFEAARSAGTKAAESGDQAGAAFFFGAALAEWSGAALADLRGLQFADDFAAAMDEERLLTISARIDADIACGRAAAVVGELVALTTEQPLREPLWGQLVTALYLSNRQAEALDACRRVRAILADLLGIDPSPALVQLEQRVLRQEPLTVGSVEQAARLAKAMNETIGEIPQAVRRGRLRLDDGRVVAIPADGLRIGRMTDNDLELDDPKVSRYHAQIRPSPAGLLIRDLQSANGVFVQGHQIDGGSILSDGDAIRIGSTMMSFEGR